MKPPKYRIVPEKKRVSGDIQYVVLRKSWRGWRRVAKFDWIEFAQAYIHDMTRAAP